MEICLHLNFAKGISGVKKVRRMSYEEMYTYLKQVPKGTYAYTILTKRIRKLDKKAIKIFS